MDYRVRPGDIEEDQVTSYLESQSAKLPTSFYLGAALASMVASLALKASGKDNLSLFIGQWAAPFLIIGTYNKDGETARQRPDSATAPAVIHPAAS